MKEISINNLGDEIFEIWDYRPITVANDTKITGTYYIGDQPPKGFEILDHGMEHEYQNRKVWLLFHRDAIQEGEFSGEITGEYPGGHFLDYYLYVQVGDHEPSAEIDTKSMHLSLQKEKSYAILVPNTVAEYPLSTELFLPEMYDEKRSLLFSIHSLQPPHNQESLDWIVTVLDNKVDCWRNNFAGELDERAHRDAWMRCMHLLKTEIWDDPLKVSEIKSLARYMLADTQSGIVKYTEIRSMILDGQEFIIWLNPHGYDTFNNIEKLGDTKFAYFAMDDLMSEYSSLLREAGASGELSWAGRIRKGAEELFPQRSELITNVSQLEPGRPYIVPGWAIGYHLAVIREPEKSWNSYSIPFESFVEFHVDDGGQPDITEDTAIRSVGFNRWPSMPHGVIKTDEEGNIQGAKVYTLPDSAIQIIKSLSELTDDHNKKGTRLYEIYEDKNPWSTMLRSKALEEIPIYLNRPKSFD